MMRCIPLVLLSLTMTTACRMTPKEIERIRVENQLLREEIQVVKEKCEFYQELELSPEQDEVSAP